MNFIQRTALKSEYNGFVIQRQVSNNRDYGIVSYKLACMTETSQHSCTATSGSSILIPQWLAHVYLSYIYYINSL